MRAGDGMKGGRLRQAIPVVTSMTDGDPVAPPPKPAGGEPASPADELTEELARSVKAAYQ